MMIELTREQCRQLNGPAPVAIDPGTKKIYVLVPESLYLRFQGMLEDRDVVATGELVDRIMAEDDANDPYLESYQAFTRKGEQ